MVWHVARLVKMNRWIGLRTESGRSRWVFSYRFYGGRYYLATGSSWGHQTTHFISPFQRSHLVQRGLERMG